MHTKLPLAMALVTAMLAAGCGTTHHFVPPMPLHKGEVGGSVGLSWSADRFASAALQGNVYLGLSDRDLIGVGLNNFVLPGSLSYAHYIPLGGDNHLNIQLHTSMFGPDPRYEADLGYETRGGELDHAVRIGIAYMGEPMLHPGSREIAVTSPPFLPVIGYDLRYRSLTLGVMTQSGAARYFAGAVKGSRSWRPDHVTSIVIPRSEVLSIDTIPPASMMARGIVDQSWMIRLADSSTVFIIASRSGINRGRGYQPCPVCADQIREQDTYTASPNHRNYIVIRERYEMLGEIEGPVMELDMPATLRRYEESGVLRIVQDPDIMELTLERITPGLDDISVGAAYIMRRR